jgi:adenosine deaminase
VKACINTDNTFFSQVNSHQEHQKALSIHGMNDAHLQQAIFNGQQAVFRR